MLRELNIDEMNAVSGGTGDEVVVTAPIKRRTAPTYLMPDIVSASAYLQNLLGGELSGSGPGGGRSNIDPYADWPTNVGITPAIDEEQADAASESCQQALRELESAERDMASALAGAVSTGLAGATLGALGVIAASNNLNAAEYEAANNCYNP